MIIHLLTLALILSLIPTSRAYAQNSFSQRPPLVVGIVVDQMRWDYLSRYYDKFTPDGFRKLIDQGYSCNNCLINYVPTITAIGHASVYTGTTPAFHGICGNNFYIDGQKVYCTADTTVQTVGTTGTKGQQSPHNMLATTIGDQLRLHTDFQSKVIGISYKDRAAIFPAGHTANAAYWLDPDNLSFITSTYYMNQLPPYVTKVNQLIKKNKEAQKAGQRIGYTPLCGTIITDMAIAALQGEQLGKSQNTDMLCVSYSHTDIIGHEWSTRGQQIDQAYIQLDKDIARLLKAIEQQVGEGNYLLFLTADHGSAHNWQYMQQHKIPAGPLYLSTLQQSLDSLCATLIDDILDYRIYLNHNSITQQNLSLQQVKQSIIDYLTTTPGIDIAVDYQNIRNAPIPQPLLDQLLMGYHPRRSGDIIFIPSPQHYSWWDNLTPTHTTHGQWNPYDAHIPLLFYGWNISQGATSRQVHINDIAPTICQILHIQQPNACTGQPITEVINK